MSYWVILIFCVPRDQFLQARMAQDIWMFVRTGLLVCKLMRNVIPPSEERRTPNTNQSISFIQFTNQIAKLPNCDIQMMKVIPFWKWSKVDITFEPKISEMQFLEIAAAYCLNNSLPSGGISTEINWIFSRNTNQLQKFFQDEFCSPRLSSNRLSYRQFGIPWSVHPGSLWCDQNSVMVFKLFIGSYGVSHSNRLRYSSSSYRSGKILSSNYRSLSNDFQVANITGRAELLMSLFLLLSLKFYISKDYLKMFIFATLSIFGKEQGIMIFVRKNQGIKKIDWFNFSLFVWWLTSWEKISLSKDVLCYYSQLLILLWSDWHSTGSKLLNSLRSTILLLSLMIPFFG